MHDMIMEFVDKQLSLLVFHIDNSPWSHIFFNIYETECCNPLGKSFELLIKTSKWTGNMFPPELDLNSNILNFALLFLEVGTHFREYFHDQPHAHAHGIAAHLQYIAWLASPHSWLSQSLPLR